MAVDPGSKKCGLAVVKQDATVLEQRIVQVGLLWETVSGLKDRYSPSMIVVGDRTGSKNVRSILSPLGIPIETIEENHSTVEGRYRYLKENTRGWARLLPIGLRVPQRPFDDYVAVILAERYLRKNERFE